MSKKTLYFEGAGSTGANGDYNGLNCRIRTAFHNDKGKMIYLEVGGGHPNKYMLKEAKKEKIKLPETYMYIHFAFYITDNPEIDDCNENQIKTIDYKEMLKISYTLENIRDFINKYFNCSFDEAVILDNLAGYKVFADYTPNCYGTSKEYNFGDCFEYDKELTEKRIAKVNEMKEHFCKLFNKKYDNTSYWIEDRKLKVCINVEEEKRIAAGYPERQFVVEV